MTATCATCARHPPAVIGPPGGESYKRLAAAAARNPRRAPTQRRVHRQGAAMIGRQGPDYSNAGISRPRGQAPPAGCPAPRARLLPCRPLPGTARRRLQKPAARRIMPCHRKVIYRPRRSGASGGAAGLRGLDPCRTGGSMGDPAAKMCGERATPHQRWRRRVCKDGVTRGASREASVVRHLHPSWTAPGRQRGACAWR